MKKIFTLFVLSILSFNSNAQYNIILSVNPDYVDVDYTSGTLDFFVTNFSCPPLCGMNYSASVTQGDTWLTIISGSYGGDQGIIRCEYLLNTSSESRFAEITVTANAANSPQVVYVNQGPFPQFTEQTSVIMNGVQNSSVAWGDYDNDNDIDILLAGYSLSGPVSKIYRNNNDNTFTEQTSILLTGVGDASVAWGDYDNDSDLDIFLSGTTSSDEVSKIYRNNGNNTFTEQTSILLSGISNSTAEWGDYDNDGDLDLLLGGTESGSNAKIYENNGDNTFTQVILLPNVTNGSVCWGDYDNDDDLDFLMTGFSEDVSTTKIFRNNGNKTFTEQSTISLIGVSYSSADWGDYNNDGYLDILLAGNNSIDGYVAKVYQNNGNNSFTEQSTIVLTPIVDGSIMWGDYDNDGDLDIVMTGSTYTQSISKIYKNNGDNTFIEQTSITLPGVMHSSVAWGDYDNDGDLDILLTGYSSSGPITKVYRNNNLTPNSLPNVPTNLSTEVIGEDTVILNWNKSSDAETPQNGLRYNIVIGSTPGAMDVLSPMSNRNTGFRRVITLGNTNHNNSWIIKDLIPGNYYWSVQSVDNNFAGSNFAPEQSFTLLDQFTEQTSVSLTGVSGSSIAWGDYDNDNDLDILLTGYSSTGPITKIYRNNGDNSFTEQTSINILGVSSGATAWGDYNNDGDLDIVLTGYSVSSPVSKIYRNNGDNTFTDQTSITLIGVGNGSVGWGDYDNDGDLDIALTGINGTGNYISKIYSNNGNNTFTDQTSIYLNGIGYGAISWGDYDNDNDLDIILAGYSNSGPLTKLYRNNGDKTFTEQSSILLAGVESSSIDWGDYDNDGDLDILLTGSDTTSYLSKLYRNNGNNTFTDQTAISLIGVTNGSAAWGDYNNDGDLDILLTGWSNSGPISKIYRNNGDNTFTDQSSISLPGVEGSSIAWCDYDNDSDLDILLTGNSSTGPITKIYRNNNLTPNTLPTAPTNLLLAALGESSVQIIWDKSTDAETPQNGLKYNLVIGTSSNAIDILSPMSNRNTGYRRVINLGNTNHNNTWTVKDLEPGNYYWSVQAIDNSFAGSAFSNEATFSVNTGTNWTHEVTMRDAAGSESTGNLFFGQKPNATNGIDPSLGEYELPAVPPLGTFDARFILPTVPAVGSLIDIRDSTETEINWLLTFQPGPGGYPMTFEWDTLTFPQGTFYLTDTLTGNTVNVNMRNQSSYVITDLSITSLYIKFQRPLSTFQLAVNVSNGWNIVSIPGLHPTDQNVNTWWAFRDPGANVFRYAGGYLSVTEATPGIGYWMKHAGARTYNTGDEWPAGGIQIVAHNPITAASGWNLFGGYELSVTAANVTTNPPGLQSGPIYVYAGGYQVATSLNPGYGYWIKLTAAGQIIIPETMVKGTEPVEYFPEDWGKIVLTDATGVSYTLYAVKGETDLSQYELPPAPMAGMFDIRFSSGRIAEDISESVKTIDMNGVVYPLTVRVEGMDIRLMDETGKNVNVNLKSGEDVVISDATIQKLMVSGEMIPAEYALEQNYPNPFNPSTKIKFSIAKDGQVSLSVFNVLGERVRELKNEMMKAGHYEVEFNASDLASGIYLYRIKAGDFVETKKMVLLK